MSDVLGARIGSDDPEEIARVRASAPQILAIGAQPTATRKQMPRSGAVYDDRDYVEGRDPRTMSPDELVAIGHAPMSPLRAIRTHCLDCCAGSSQEVAKCMAERCPSWPYRMGTNPWRARPSDEQRQAMRERGRRLAEANRSLVSDAEDRGAGHLSLPEGEPRKSVDFRRLGFEQGRRLRCRQRHRRGLRPRKVTR
jgi:hypothetical protein